MFRYAPARPARSDTRRTIINGAILGGLAFPADGLAQPFCAERDRVVSRLETGYGETFAGGGMQSGTRIFEVWTSEENGTWTILLTRADGSSGIMASGTHWREGIPTAELSGVPG